MSKAGILLLILMGCGGCAVSNGHDQDADGHAGPEDAHSEAESPDSDLAQLHGGPLDLDHLTGIAFADVGEPVEEGVWVAAEAVPDETGRRGLTAPVAGVVAAIRVAPGREVAAGKVLVEIRSTELAQLRSRLAMGLAELERATAELAREERLAAASAGIQREHEAARAAVAVATAETEAARLELVARGIDPQGSGVMATLRAPGTGRVASWSVLEGEGVEAGRALGYFETGAAALVRVELALPGAPSWNPGVSARVRRADGVEWQAQVEGVPTSLDTSTRRLGYRLRIAEPPRPGVPRPLAGTPLEVRVPLPPGIVVPQTALQQIEGVWGVFVAEGTHASFRPVRRGPELGGDVLVLEGLNPGERVATGGAYLLKSLSLKRSGGGGDGHAH